MPERLASSGWKTFLQRGFELEWIILLQGDTEEVVQELQNWGKAAKVDLLSGTEYETKILQASLESITDVNKIEELYDGYCKKLDENFQNFRKVKNRLASLWKKITAVRESQLSYNDKSLKKYYAKFNETSQHAPEKEELSSAMAKKDVQNLDIPVQPVSASEMKQTRKKLQCMLEKLIKSIVDLKEKNSPLSETIADVEDMKELSNKSVSTAPSKSDAKDTVIPVVPKQAGSINGEPNVVSQYQNAPRRIENIEKALKVNLKKKATKRVTIGTEGGEMELHGCKVAFPKNAVKKPTTFELSVDNHPENFPKKGFPITPILGVEPPVKFRKPVTTKMRTCYSAAEGKEIRAQILCKEDEGDWQPGEKVTLSHRNEVSFKVWHFSDRVVVVSEENSEDGEYHIFNDVYIKPKTATILSVFCMDQKAQSDSWDTMKDSNYEKALPLHEEIIVAPHSTVQVSVKCEEPENITYQGPMGNPSSVKITPNFRKKQHIKRYFHPKKFPANYEGTFRADYHVKKEQDISETDEDDDENICASLIVSWPIQPDSAATGGQTINLTAAFNVADHEAEQSITENNTSKRMKMTSSTSPRN